MLKIAKDIVFEIVLKIFYIPLCEFLLIPPEISCPPGSPALSKLSPKCPHQTQTQRVKLFDEVF